MSDQIETQLLKERLAETLRQNRLLQNELDETNHGLIALTMELEKKNEEIRAAEQKYRSIFENATEGIFRAAPDSCYQVVNPALARIFGYNRPEELVSLYSGINYATLLEGKNERRGIERKIRRNDGTLIWVAETVRAVRDDRGHTLYFEGTIEDITKRKKAEAALKESEERYRQIVETAIEGICVMDQTGRITFTNRMMAEMLGYTVEEMIGQSIYDLIDGASGVIAAAQIRGAQREVPEPLEMKLRRKSGEFRWAAASINPFFELNGKYSGALAMVTDITERKRLEKEMARLDQLHLVGEMAASISHEIRNPMTVVRGYLQFLEGHQEMQAYRQQFGIMIEELDRANDIIAEYLTLARNKAVEMKRQDLNKIILTLLPLIQAEAVKTHKTVTVETSSIPNLLLDEKEIKQVILNLTRNGLEAMSEDGILTIKTYQTGEEVILAVRDQGMGIPPEVTDKIGTPFFTTKEKGTGLGLAVCYSIAARHQASIQIKTGSGGTTFLVCFRV